MPRRRGPRECQACRAPILGNRPGVIRYCEPCRAQFCRECSRRGGQHRPGCGRETVRLCRGCGAPILPDADSLAQHRAVPAIGDRGAVGDGRSLRYCLPCRSAQCHTCQRHGGQHAPACPVGAGRGRVPLPYRGVVSEPALLEIYANKRALAVRIAASICGRDAEDVVQNVVFYLWRRLDTLTGLSVRFFLECVKQSALGRTRAAWRRRAVLSDDLVAVERRLVRRRGPVGPG